MPFQRVYAGPRLCTNPSTGLRAGQSEGLCTIPDSPAGRVPVRPLGAGTGQPPQRASRGAQDGPSDERRAVFGARSGARQSWLSLSSSLPRGDAASAAATCWRTCENAAASVLSIPPSGSWTACDMS